MPTNAGLRLFQWGGESTHGTAVAATSKIAIEELELTPDDQLDRPKIARGLMLRNPGFEFATMRGTRFVARGPFNYEQFQNWLNMAVALDASPTGTDPYTWTHTRNPAAIPTLKSQTLERRRTDGSSPVDEEVAYCLAQSIKLTGGRSGRVNMEISGFGRRIQSSTLTAGQSMPTIEPAPVALATLYADDDWASVGGTQIASQVLEWSWTFNTGIVPLMTHDGRTDLDFTTHVIDGDQVGIEFEATILAGAQMATEKTKAEAAALRAVQLHLAGSDSRELSIDMLLKHTAGTVITLGKENGQDVTRLQMQDSTDGTNLLSAELINKVASLA